MRGKTIILGAGISGLSVSHHLGHENTLILEKNSHPYGHLVSENRDGFVWDEGPHVSFTKNEYVRKLFAENVQGSYLDYEVRTSNYFKGYWIDHPAQSSLHQVPDPLRTQCLDSFLSTRQRESENPPKNYQEWLDRAFGPVFANTFPSAYTRKYWTVEPSKLSTSWVGPRVYYPSVEDVIKGAIAPLEKKTHYVTNVRYPKTGGFQSFVEFLSKNCNIIRGFDVCSIDLKNSIIHSSDGRSVHFERLVNTLPLPLFISYCQEVPANIREAARQLVCSQLLLVNAFAPHPTRRSENWMYIYDEDKLSTRINCTELLSPENGPKGWTGVQTEIYFSRFKPLDLTTNEVAKKVLSELEEMNLLDSKLANFHTKFVPWANIIFDLETREQLNRVWSWLEKWGLSREADDLEPLTDWANASPVFLTKLAMAGRFAQWKYYWTDDCVLRGRQLQAN